MVFLPNFFKISTLLKQKVVSTLVFIEENILGVLLWFYLIIVTIASSLYFV